eukprot:UN17418
MASRKYKRYSRSIRNIIRETDWTTGVYRPFCPPCQTSYKARIRLPKISGARGCGMDSEKVGVSAGQYRVWPLYSFFLYIYVLSSR